MKKRMIRILRIIKAFPEAALNGFRWQKALHYASIGDPKTALGVLDKMSRTRSSKFEIDMLKARMLYSEHRWHECLILCDTMLSRIDDQQLPNDDTRQYCIVYIGWLGDWSEKKIRPQHFQVKARATNDMLEQIDMSNVPEYIKENNPFQPYHRQEPPRQK